MGLYSPRDAIRDVLFDYIELLLPRLWKLPFAARASTQGALVDHQEMHIPVIFDFLQELVDLLLWKMRFLTIVANLSSTAR
jgi:hypothetical protein|eukprot:scaffold8103_cov166-Alexandrium_tamarense.AAC.5